MQRIGRFKGVLLVTALVSITTPTVSSKAQSSSAGGTIRHAQSAQRPNVLVIVADDLGFADVGFNGAAFPTPNIDRIAKMGMKLERFYTSPLCSPTRAGLLTGRYPHRYGIMGDTITPGSDFGLSPKEETIASVLGRAGYDRRSFIGKWHLGHRSAAFHPMSFGFTSFYGHYNGAIDYFTHERQGQPDWHRDRVPSADQGYATDLMTEEAVRTIATPSPGGNPWFLWLAYNAPHGPLQAKEEDLEAAGFDARAGRFALGRNAADEGGELGRGNTRRQTAIAMIRAMDKGIGRILDALEKSGQLENTLILFTSDNGGPGRWGPGAERDMQSSNGALRGYKFQHYEGGVRVAAAISWPARLKPRDSAGVGAVAYVDLLPTIANLARATLRAPVDGQDVSASLLTGRKLPKRAIFLGEDYSQPAITGERGPTDPEALRGRAASVIVGRWKLLGDQLFDIESDPSEQRDLASQRPDIVNSLKGTVSRFVAQRQIPRGRMNEAQLPPLERWTLKSMQQ